MNNSDFPRSERGSDIYEARPRHTPPKAAKVSILWLLLNLIFLIIFNVFFFMLGNPPHNFSVWLSYGFIHIAYILLVATPILTRKGKSSSVFGFALYSISAAYFIVALVVGIVFILLALESNNVAFLVQLSIAAIYSIVLIANMIANERTADTEEERQYQIDYVKNATVQLKLILDRVKDKESKKKVEKAYDAVNSSPVKSHPNLEQMELRILTLIDELDAFVASGDKQSIVSTADSLFSAVNERNSRLKNYAR